MSSSGTPRACVVVAALLLFVSAAGAKGNELLVTNVQAQQLAFTALVDVTYDLETVDGVPVMVRLFLSTNGGAGYPYLCQAVDGEVGSDILPGSSRHIVWDMGAELPGFSSATCRLRVTADDGDNLDDFVYITPGAYMMGSPVGEPGRYPNETQHQVTLTRGIYVQITEVTNRQYMELAQWAYDHGYATVSGSFLYDSLDGSTLVLKQLGSGDCEVDFLNGQFSCTNPDHPVKYETWFGAAAYCDWLSLRQQLPRAYDHSTWRCNGGNPYAATGYRLPTEAEWEHACRAGSTTAFANGPVTRMTCDPLDLGLDEIGWYCGNAGGWTHPVAQKAPNSWGLYDMHGNLWEWCNDWWTAYGGAVTDPTGAATGIHRVIRGGYWTYSPPDCRSARRDAEVPSSPFNYVGFRPVRSAN